MDNLSKSELLAMNANKQFGLNWIRNIENIKDNEKAKLYPTGDSGMSGKLYVALQATLVLTSEIIAKFNIWL